MSRMSISAFMLGQRERRAGARAHAQVGRPPRPERRIGGDARRALLEAYRSAPLVTDLLDRRLPAASRVGAHG